MQYLALWQDRHSTANAGLTDAAWLADFTNPTIAGWQDVDAGAIAGICEMTLWTAADSSQGYITEHIDAMRSASPPTTASIVAGKLYRMITRGSSASTFQMSDAASRATITQMLDALVAAGMDSSAETAILAPAQFKLSRADTIGCSGATLLDLAAANEFAARGGWTA